MCIAKNYHIEATSQGLDDEVILPAVRPGGNTLFIYRRGGRGQECIIYIYWNSAPSNYTFLIIR